MSSFDEQVRKRQEHDELHLKRAVRSLAGVVTREEIYESGMRLDDAEDAALQDLCRHFGLPDKELPSELASFDEKMDYLLESRGVMRRHVSLEGAWWQDMTGPVLATRTSDGAHIPLLQDFRGRYYYKDRAANRDVRISSAMAADFEREALCFYRPLPNRALTPRDMLVFALGCPSRWDWGIMLVTTLLITLFGMIAPRATELLFSSVIPTGSDLRLATTAVLLVSMAVGTWLASTFQSTCNARITQKVSFGVSAAAFGRMLSMPTGFFKPYSSGNMASRLTAMQTIATTLMTALLTGGLTTVFSLLYIAQITNLAPTMLVPALVAIGVQLLVSLLLVLSQRKLQNRIVIANAKLSGTVYSLFSGVQKIKLAGAESRAYHKWAGSYQEKAAAQYAPPPSMLVLSALAPAVSILGSALIYAAGAANLTLSSYMAFQTAYGLCAATIMNLSSIAGQLAGVGPALDLARPLLESVPETSGDREAVLELGGRIDVSKLSFRYTEEGPWVLDGIDLSIAPGSYVAVVGTTGCGKSTLMRLLLGFETPQVGAVFYDGKDLARLDVRSVRHHIGTVLQDGRLFNGSIFSNIVLCAPEKTQAVAWEAAEIAQIADDIKAMPMGMHTMLSGGGVSGGQRQRLLIARAVAGKPSVLIFDEATSALDNITQAKVSEALDAMDCTRIVVAHRLSTIRNCDRIIVLDHGHIVEDGSYDELIAAEGFFAQLVSRQQA